MFKKSLLCTLFIALFMVFVTPVAADDGGFYFKNYEVYVVVRQDASADVKIIADTYFEESRHGIYLEIPTEVTIKRQKADGSYDKYYYSPEIRNVYVEGADFEYDGEGSIKIGSPDYYVRGNQRYVIRYRYIFGDDMISDYDEFYYSLIGSGWDTNFENVTFRVSFDGNPKINSVEMYRGKKGKNTTTDFKFENNVISGEVQNLTNHQALTVWARMDEGYYSEVTKRTYKEVYNVLIVLGVLVALIALRMVYKNYLQGAKRIEPNSEAYLIKQLPSCDVGYIMDSSIEDRDLYSLIYWFAAQGYITIDEHGKVHPTDKSIDDLPTYLEAMYSAFLTNESTGSNLYRAMNEARAGLKKKYKHEKKLKSGAWISNILVISLSLCSLVALIILGDYNANVLVMIFANLLYQMIALIAATTMMYEGQRRVVEAKSAKGFYIFLIIYSLIFAGIVRLAMNGETRSITYFIIMLTALGYALTGETVNASKYWISMAGNIQAFAEDIKYIDLETIEEMMEENHNYYFDVIPYAYAFGLLDEWEAAFKGFDFSKYKDYYYYDYHYVRHYHRYCERCESNVESYGSSISSSSSSSGGSSGGGFGGGGGGSW